MIYIKHNKQEEEEKKEIQEINEVLGFIDEGLIITELSVNNENLSNAQFKELSLVIEKINSLKRLVINDIMENIDVKNISQSVAKCQSLTNLNFESSSISRRGAMYVADAISSENSIINVSLADNKISDEGIKYLMSKMSDNFSEVEFLKIGGNYVTQASTESIARFVNESNYLKKIYLPRNNIGDKGCSHICEALYENGFLDAIDISINNFATLGAMEIAKMIERNNKLQSLYMHSNKIGDDGAKYVADSITKNNSLKHVDLSNNEIGQIGAKAINNAMKINGSILSMNANGNNFKGNLTGIDEAECSINMNIVQAKKLVAFIKNLRISHIDHEGKHLIRSFAEFIEFSKDLDIVRRNKIKIKELVHVGTDRGVFSKVMESRNEISNILLNDEGWPEYYVEYGFEILTEYFMGDEESQKEMKDNANANESYGKSKQDSSLSRILSIIFYPFLWIFAFLRK